MGFAYDGFSQLRSLIRLKNGNERAHTAEYDLQGRTVKSTDAKNSAPGTVDPKFSTAKYEPFCGGTATTSARGVRRRAYIDNLCRLTEIEVGAVGTDDFEVANVSERRIFEYDDLGRLLKTKQGSASGGSVYGQAVYGTNAYGASGSASMDERSYVYDSLDRVEKVTFEDGKTMEYFYDFEGNVLRVVENASGTPKTTLFSYYGDNRLYQVTYVRASGDQVFTYDYDPGGRPKTLTYPASTGIVAEFKGPNDEPGWDGNGQLKHLRYMKGTDTIRRFAFEYDLAGNRISQLDVVDIAQPLTQRAVEWVYGYDWLDRLESVKKREATTVAGLGPAPLQLTSVYQYDAADNRIEFKVPNLQQPELTETFTYGYDAADNILSISKAVGTGSASEIETFTSDDDGNLKTRTSGGVTTEYHWNDFNRLAAISTSDNSKKQSHTFGVNGFRRKKKDKNDVETTEYAAGLATAVSKAQASDTITYLMGPSLMGFERESDGTMFWNICDALSTVRDIVDSSGTVVASYEFSEYGQRIASTENGVSSQKTFVGGLSVQDEVADIGLMMMGHRFYDPNGSAGGTGRFLNRDPIGFLGGLNLFEYAGSDPIGFVDHYGLQRSPEGQVYGLNSPQQEEVYEAGGMGLTAIALLLTIGFPDATDLAIFSALKGANGIFKATRGFKVIGKTLPSEREMDAAEYLYLKGKKVTAVGQDVGNSADLFFDAKWWELKSLSQKCNPKTAINSHLTNALDQYYVKVKDAAGVVTRIPKMGTARPSKMRIVIDGRDRGLTSKELIDLVAAHINGNPSRKLYIDDIMVIGVNDYRTFKSWMIPIK